MPHVRGAEQLGLARRVELLAERARARPRPRPRRRRAPRGPSRRRAGPRNRGPRRVAEARGRARERRRARPRVPRRRRAAPGVAPTSTPAARSATRERVAVRVDRPQPPSSSLGVELAIGVQDERPRQHDLARAPRARSAARPPRRRRDVGGSVRLGPQAGVLERVAGARGRAGPALGARTSASARSACGAAPCEPPGRARNAPDAQSSRIDSVAGRRRRTAMAPGDERAPGPSSRRGRSNARGGLASAAARAIRSGPVDGDLGPPDARRPRGPPARRRRTASARRTTGSYARAGRRRHRASSSERSARWLGSTPACRRAAARRRPRAASAPRPGNPPSRSIATISAGAGR